MIMDNCVLVSQDEYQDYLNKRQELEDKIEYLNNILERGYWSKIGINVNVVLVRESLSGHYFTDPITTVSRLSVDFDEENNVHLSQSLKEFTYNSIDKIERNIIEEVQKLNQDSVTSLQNQIIHYNELPWYKKIFVNKLPLISSN